MIRILQIVVAYPTSNYIFYRNYDNCYLFEKSILRMTQWEHFLVTIQTEKTNLLAVLPHAFTLRWSNLRYIHSFEIFIQAEE